jgi:hypothetical protein
VNQWSQGPPGSMGTVNTEQRSSGGGGWRTGRRGPSDRARSSAQPRKQPVSKWPNNENHHGKLRRAPIPAPGTAQRTVWLRTASRAAMDRSIRVSVDDDTVGCQIRMAQSLQTATDAARTGKVPLGSTSTQSDSDQRQDDRRRSRRGG